MEEYCKENKLTFNGNKSKVLVFSRGKIKNKPEMYYGDELLECIMVMSYWKLFMIMHI
jgi:hypothetical protein